MRFLGSNAVAVLTALVAVMFAWIYGGIRPQYVVPVMPWAWLILAEAMLCFPEARPGESTFAARARVCRAFRSDPLVWLTAAFTVLLLVPLVNVGLCPQCDAELIAAGRDAAPPLPFLPFCANRPEHLTTLVWFVPALTCALAVRHSMRRHGKRLVLTLVVISGVMLGVLGLVQKLLDAPGPLWANIANLQRSDFFSTFGYANMAGDYFATLFGLSIGLWRDHADRCRREDARNGRRIRSSADLFRLLLARHWPLLASAVLFVSALATLSRAAILIVTAMAGVLFVHTLASFLARLRPGARLAAVAVAVGVAFALVSAVGGMLPKSLRKEAGKISLEETVNRVTGKSSRGTSLAFAVWRDYPVFGCGGNGYRHFSRPKMTSEDTLFFEYDWGRAGLANVHNDCVQILAEYGLAGLALLAAIVVLVVLPSARAWRVRCRAARLDGSRYASPSGRAFFTLPPGAFAVALTAGATLVHSLGDCPLRSPAVLTLFFVSLAAAEGFFPHETTEESQGITKCST